eukprot:TRINITY_DN6541_c0_g1_i1.p1 TRINITY_DN6541_c0_g1~~TRINITY_DN6541_c0_g1_i1.p1  ORF type:complete len:372 (-),score=55.07 TRINITY_DN6541_c0_g1_i1:13-1128(-)
MAIFKSSIKIFKDDFKFAKKFISILKWFPHMRSLYDGIYNEIRKFESEEAKLLFITRPLTQFTSPKITVEEIELKRSLSHFKEAMKQGTPRLVELWLQFLMKKYLIYKSCENSQGLFKQAILDTAEFCLSSYNDMFTSKAYLIWIRLSLANEAIQNSKTLLDQALNRFQNDEHLWVTYLLTLVAESDQKSPDQNILNSFKRSFENVPKQKQSLLWETFFDYGFKVGINLESLIKDYKKAILSGCSDLERIKSRFISLAIQYYGNQKNIDQIRKVYTMTFQLAPKNELNIYKICIHFETEIARQFDVARQLFENAISSFGSTSRLWLDYIDWEINREQFKNISNLFWRAKNTLVQPELGKFLRSYGRLYANV